MLARISATEDVSFSNRDLLLPYKDYSVQPIIYFTFKIYFLVKFYIPVSRASIVVSIFNFMVQNTQIILVLEMF